MHRLFAAIVKETLMILRDREALLILFLMPAVFVLIMSLALRGPFSERAGVRFPLLVVNADDGEIGRHLAEQLGADRHFAVEVRGAEAVDMTAIEAALRAGRYRFAVLIPQNATKQAVARAQERLGLARRAAATAPVAIRLLTDPAVRPESRAFMAAALGRALGDIETRMVLRLFAETGRRLDTLRSLLPGLPVIQPVETLEVFAPLDDSGGNDGSAAAWRYPSATQQNVPAYALFAMFFVVVPLSVTFIKERSQGTLWRLRAMATPGWVLLGGKIAPYFLLNQLQFAFLLLEGLYLLPLFGAEALELGHSPAGLLLLSAAASLGAIGYGLLIAMYARTPEQATHFGALSVIILAAIGGLLVPKMVMPEALQRLTDLSPLSWGLEGFLDLFVRAGGVAEVLPRAAGLAAFGLACLVVAALRFARGFGHN